MMLDLKKLFTCVFSLLLSHCGNDGGKKNNLTDPQNDHLLRLTPAELKIGTETKIWHELGAHESLEARFSLRADISYRLHLASYSIATAGCGEDKPTTSFSWQRNGEEGVTELLANSEFDAEAGGNYTLLVAVNALEGCSSVGINFMVEDLGRSPVDKDLQNITFVHKSLIYEGDKTAALFLLKPMRQQPLDITIRKVRGPTFLGQAQVGTLDRSQALQLVANGLPLEDSERDALVAAHEGAGFVFFSDYDGELCSEAERTLSIDYAMSERVLTSDIAFVARHNTGGWCQLLRSIMTTAACDC